MGASQEDELPLNPGDGYLDLLKQKSILDHVWSGFKFTCLFLSLFLSIYSIHLTQSVDMRRVRSEIQTLKSKVSVDQEVESNLLSSLRNLSNRMSVYECDPGFTQLGQECFQYHAPRDGFGYHEAVQVCRREGGNLYEPKSVEQQQLVNDYVRLQDVDAVYYIGVHDKTTESNFVFESSGDPIDFSNWDEGEPSNHDDREHCVEVVTIKDGKWNDIPCNWKVGYVCQNQAHQSNQTRPSSGQKEIMFDCYRTDKLTRASIVSYDGCFVDTTNGAMNRRSGIFSVAEPGIYQLTFTAKYVSSNKGRFGAWSDIYVNHTVIVDSQREYNGPDATRGGSGRGSQRNLSESSTHSVSVLYPLHRGDQVKVQFNKDGHSYIHSDNDHDVHFTGRRVAVLPSPPMD